MNGLYLLMAWGNEVREIQNICEVCRRGNSMVWTVAGLTGIIVTNGIYEAGLILPSNKKVHTAV